MSANDVVRMTKARQWRFLWWSITNWRKGLRFGPIARCRFCDHTTPYHYKTCRLASPVGCREDAR